MNQERREQFVEELNALLWKYDVIIGVDCGEVITVTDHSRTVVYKVGTPMCYETFTLDRRQ